MRKLLEPYKDEKAPGPSGLTSDLLKYDRTTGLEALTSVFQKVLKEDMSPPEQSVSFTLPLFKKKGCALFCRKHRDLTTDLEWC